MLQDLYQSLPTELFYPLIPFTIQNYPMFSENVNWKPCQYMPHLPSDDGKITPCTAANTKEDIYVNTVYWFNTIVDFCFPYLLIYYSRQCWNCPWQPKRVTPTTTSYWCTTRKATSTDTVTAIWLSSNLTEIKECSTHTVSSLISKRWYEHQFFCWYLLIDFLYIRYLNKLRMLKILQSYDIYIFRWLVQIKWTCTCLYLFQFENLRTTTGPGYKYPKVHEFFLCCVDHIRNFVYNRRSTRFPNMCQIR